MFTHSENSSFKAYKKPDYIVPYCEVMEMIEDNDVLYNEYKKLLSYDELIQFVNTLKIEFVFGKITLVKK